MIEENVTPTIMLVDDTPANLSLLEEILDGQGYNIVAFPRGKMALQAMDKVQPHLILLDIMMPEMNGFDVCRQLRSDGGWSDIPVIFISALDDTENKVKAFTQGGVDYITKPFQAEEVLARVRTHIRLHQIQLRLEKFTQHLESLVEEKVKEVLDSQLATLVAISNLAEFPDEDTGHHIERTRSFCKILAENMREKPAFQAQINDEFIDAIYHAAPLHDIGKVGIPDNILLKPGKLTEDEFEVMKTHVSIGVQTLKKVQESYPNNAFIQKGIEFALHHHERWDGDGYPDGLKGEEIPLSGRIIALADVYDALRSVRSYKEAFSHEESYRIIIETTGKHFDPAVVEAFIACEKDFENTYNKLADEK